jgi:hypothetical protein
MKLDDENYYINLDDKVLIENQRCVIFFGQPSDFR